MNKSSSCSIRKKITALLLSLCLAAAFVPTVGAASDTGETQPVDSAEFIVPVDESATQTVAPDTTTQATESTTQATEATTQATEETTVSTKSYSQASSVNNTGSFENVETDGRSEEHTSELQSQR